MLNKNDKAPDFSCKDQNDNEVSLSALLSVQNVILYFYPKDDTPGCTIEANEFTALREAFANANTKVIGVSKDNCSSHTAFINKFSLDVDLLADESGELCEKFNVWQEKEKNGVKKMGIVRSTFLIKQDGTIAHAEYGVVPEGHAAVMLALAQAL